MLDVEITQDSKEMIFFIPVHVKGWYLSEFAYMADPRSLTPAKNTASASLLVSSRG